MDLLKGLNPVSGKNTTTSVMSAIGTAIEAIKEIFADIEEEFSWSQAATFMANVIDIREKALLKNPNLFDLEVQEIATEKSLVSEDLLVELQDIYLPLSQSAYRPENEVKNLVNAIEDLQFLSYFSAEDGQIGKPHFLIAYSGSRKEVFISIKGTSSIDDVVTDLLMTPGNTDAMAEECLVHSGIAHAAEYVIHNIKPILQDLFIPLEYTITFTGHSLGAGTAALAAMMLAPEAKGKHQLPAGSKVRCICFAPPPVVGIDQAKAAGKEGYGNVLSVVNRYDIIPKSSLRNAKALYITVSLWKEESFNELMDKVDNAEEIIAWLKTCHGEDVTLGNEDMYIPGNVVYLYEKDSSTKTLDSIMTDCELNALKRIDLDSNFVSDHFLQSYKNNLDNLLKRTPKTEEEEEREQENAKEKIKNEMKNENEEQEEKTDLKEDKKSEINCNKSDDSNIQTREAKITEEFEERKKHIRSEFDRFDSKESKQI